MSVTYARNHAQLTTSAVATYTAPAGIAFAVIEAATATNAGTGAHTVTVHIVDSGGSAGNTNIVIDVKSLAENVEAVLDGLIGHVLAPGDTVEALADAITSINLQVSVREVT